MGSSKRTVQPPGWAKPRGYSNGIVAEGGRTLFVGGQIGWDPTSETPRFPATFAEQFDAALANVLAVVKEAGGTPQDLVRCTVYVINKDAYRSATRQIGESWKRQVGKHYPAMALVVVSALLEDDAQVEIEATAVI
ncbi:MAG: RidA family protein [Myxococcota bacterium]|nr:RidA family protein [Myxococcota bacterium]